MSAGEADSAGAVPASAVSNGSVAVPPNGALISTTERKTSGRATAHHDATQGSEVVSDEVDVAVAERRQEAFDPASRTCTRNPLPLTTNRERTPRGNTPAAYGPTSSRCAGRSNASAGAQGPDQRARRA